jgi:NADP-dependent 3-hydroxy acid dehydrogenase YdfG
LTCIENSFYNIWKEKIFMIKSKVWFITGASSGIGLEVAKSALAAGHKVVATGRDTDKVSKSFRAVSHNLLIAKMDVTNTKEIGVAVKSPKDP